MTFIRAIKTILYSSHFKRAFRQLPRELQEEASRREALFRQNCFDQRLKTHKLHGQQRELWSFSVSHSYRILFRFISDDTVYFIDAGDHSIYQ